MTFLPIVERELRVVSRKSATYRNRILFPAFLAVIVILEVLLSPFAPQSVSLSRTIYTVLSSLSLVICIFSGVWSTADCLSGEKREGTLGLLFLTDLDGYDVILGKLAAALLTSTFALFAILPVLAWTLLLGGVTMGEVWRMGFALINVLFFSIVIGLWVSSRSRSASSAMGATFFLVMLFLLAPVPFKPSPFAPFSPAYAFFSAPAVNYTAHPFYYWESLLLAQVFIWCFLAHASKGIKRFRDEELSGASSVKQKGNEESSSSKAKIPRQRAKPRSSLLDLNPISWLASHDVDTPKLVWVLVFLAGATIAFIAAFPLLYDYFLKASRLFSVRAAAIQPFMSFMSGYGFVGFLIIMNAAIKVFVASQACRCHAEARRNSTLEILLTTPIKVQDILQGQVHALKRTFLKPLLLLLVFEMAGIFALLYQVLGNSGPQLTGRFIDTVLFVEVGFIIFFLLDFQGVIWSGIWFGLCSKNESHATAKTTFYVILGPMLLLVLYFIGAALFLFWPIVSFVRARLKLQEHFRYLAGHRFTSGREASIWLPLRIPETSEDSQAGLASQLPIESSYRREGEGAVPLS